MMRAKWLTLDRPNLLLSSVGRRSYLVEWFKEALAGSGKVCATNSDSNVPALASADIAEESPLIYSDDYIPFLLDFCERNHVGAIIPLFDIDIPILAAHREEFERRGVCPVVASEAFVRICADKVLTAKLLGDIGIAHPATYVGAEEFLDANKQGLVSFPAFVKPRWGMGSIGLAIARNEEELRVLCNVIRHKVDSSYLRYESTADPHHAVVVQPVLKGQEYGMDIINNLEGRYCGCVVRKKLAMRAGETDVAEIMPAGKLFESVARKLSEISRHPGNMDVDLFELDGELSVLEMNARFGGGYPFSHAAGVNLPKAIVSWLSGENTEELLLQPTCYGTYMKDITIVRTRS